MIENDKIQLFEDQPIRTAWDEKNEEWYFFSRRCGWCYFGKQEFCDILAENEGATKKKEMKP